MISLCIKTNNSDSIQYLLNELRTSTLNDVCFSQNSFRHYKNVIIHYKGNLKQEFISKISSILSFLVIDNYEEDFLKRILLCNYFYFNSVERNQILDICFDIMADGFTEIFNRKFKLLYNSFFEFLLSNKILILDGFLNFRVKDYMVLLDDIVNTATNHYIVEKEYLEFISLLKLYINSRSCETDTIHLIYSSNESILLDNNKEIIQVTGDFLNAKILSDISFSSNDYILNTLLTLLPKNIFIHLIDNYKDEFINTLELIFEKRIHICTNCDICEFYKSHIKTNEK